MIRDQGRVPAGSREATERAHRRKRWSDKRDAVLGHEAMDFICLETDARVGCASTVVSHGKGWNHLKALEVMRPDGKRSRAGRPSHKIMARVPINITLVKVSMEGAVATQRSTYLITSLRFLFRAKLTAIWTCLTEVAFTT